MKLNNTNTDVSSELSSRCESEIGMRHISFWLVGFGLTEVGPRVGTSGILEVPLNQMLNNNGSLATVVQMENGNE
jgi:hypothetical protein